MKDPLDGLNDKQKLFAIEYLEDFNATKAAIRAGYAEDSARVQGARLLTNDAIKKYVKAQVDDILDSEKPGLKKRILVELAGMAFGNVQQGGLRHSDKTKALELLGKYLTLFTDKVEHSIPQFTFNYATAPDDADQDNTD